MSSFFLQSAESRRMYQRCRRCGISRYEHMDHEHIGARAEMPSHCPFGDCGEFQEPA